MKEALLSSRLSRTSALRRRISDESPVSVMSQKIELVAGIFRFGKYPFLCYRKFLAFQYVVSISKNREAIVATESEIPFFMRRPVQWKFSGLLLRRRVAPRGTRPFMGLFRVVFLRD